MSYASPVLNVEDGNKQSFPVSSSIPEEMAVSSSFAEKFPRLIFLAKGDFILYQIRMVVFN